MKRIVIHWTAGTNKPCNTDLEHYHFIIDSAGRVYQGKYTPEDNLNCKDGKYAQHTGGGNTDSIGIALCGMYGFKNRTDVGKYPLSRIQCERCFSLCAELCKKYNILPVTANNVFTHYEFGQKNPKTTSYGKIDIIHLPPYPEISKDNIGKFIRTKVMWYLQRHN